MSVTITKSLSLTSAFLSAAMLIASTGSALAATTHNPNINQSKAELKAKCQRSGGDFTVERNGVYRCVVNGEDTFTVVECKNGKCEGYIFPNERKTDPFSRFRTEKIISPNDVIAPSDIIAPSNIVAPNNFTLMAPTN